VVGSSHPSASASKRAKVPWRSVFCSGFPRFLKKNKSDRFLRFPSVLKSFNSPGAMLVVARRAFCCRFSLSAET
jgi:hypothetical protein